MQLKDCFTLTKSKSESDIAYRRGMGKSNGVFPEWIRNVVGFSEFRKSDQSLKHKLGLIFGLACAVVASWSLTQEVAGSSPFKDPVSHMCLAGTVVAS